MLRNIFFYSIYRYDNIIVIKDYFRQINLLILTSEGLSSILFSIKWLTKFDYIFMKNFLVSIIRNFNRVCTSYYYYYWRVNWSIFANLRDSSINFSNRKIKYFLFSIRFGNLSVINVISRLPVLNLLPTISIKIFDSHLLNPKSSTDT